MSGALWTELNRRLGVRRARAIFDRVRDGGARRPRIDAAAIALVAFSTLVWASGLALPAAGVWLVAAHPNRVLAWLGGILLVAVAWLLRPRWRRIPVEDRVDPEAHPRLSQLVEDIARAAGTAPPRVLAVDGRYGAAVARAGWTEGRVLVLGLPLLTVLDGPALVALIAHEIAHLANGDLARRAFVGTAVRAVGQWADILTPQRWDEAGLRPAHRAGVLALWVLSLPSRSMLWVMSRLAFGRTQVAEYYADRLGASISGTEGFLRLFSATSDHRALARAQHAVVVAGAGRSVLAEVPRQAMLLLPSEIAADTAWETTGTASLDGTHPPLALRARMLLERPPEPPQIVLGAADFQWVRRELEAHRERVDRRLADAYRMDLEA